MGRRLKRQGDPIFGYELKQAVKYGKVMLKKRAVAAGPAGIQFQDGSELSVRNVIWATGFIAHYDWLHNDTALDHNKAVIHTRGISPVKGLYYVGLPGRRTGALRSWQEPRGMPAKSFKPSLEKRG